MYWRWKCLCVRYPNKKFLAAGAIYRAGGAFRKSAISDYPPILNRKRLLRKKINTIRGMECPHCLKSIETAFYTNIISPSFNPDKYGKFCITFSTICPNSDCRERIIYCIFPEDRSIAISRDSVSAKTLDNLQDKILLFPKIKKRKQFPPDSGISADFIKDYEEASAVLDISPKASAALSRRLLQRLLRDKAGVKPSIR